MRRPLIAAAAAAVALTLLPATSAADETARGVDIDPPAVGSCHATTLDEGMAKSDPDAPVPCTDKHTMLTFKVIDLGSSPDWSDMDALGRIVSNRCWPAWIDALGGNPKVIDRSVYTYFWFIPTKAQREAGATWANCDAALWGGRDLAPLPGKGDITLGGLPLPAKVAKCRTGKPHDYVFTVCSRPHAFKATLSVKYPHKTYPGRRVAARWAQRACEKRVSGAYFYEAVHSKVVWKSGFRHAVCLTETN